MTQKGRLLIIVESTTGFQTKGNTKNGNEVTSLKKEGAMTTINTI